MSTSWHAPIITTGAPTRLAWLTPEPTLSKATNIPAVLTAVIAVTATIGMAAFFLDGSPDLVTPELTSSGSNTQPGATASRPSVPADGSQHRETPAKPTGQAVTPPPLPPEAKPAPDHPLRVLIDALVAEYLATRSNTGAKSDPFDLFAATRKAKAIDELIERLAGLGDDAIPHLLTALLEHLDRDVKTYLAKGLTRMASPQADDAVVTLFEAESDAPMKTGVILELRKRQDPEAGDLLARLYQSERAAAAARVEAGAPDRGGAIRAALLRSLAQNDPARHVGALAEAAQTDPDPSVRAQAVDLLWKCPDPIAVALLARMLDEEKDPRVLQAAIVSYARLTGEAALSALEDLMDRPNASDRIRASVIYALSQVGGARAEQLLATIRDYDRSPPIRERAGATLAALRRNAATAESRPRVNIQGTIPLRAPAPPGGEAAANGANATTPSDGADPADQVQTLPPGARPVIEQPPQAPKE